MSSKYSLHVDGTEVASFGGGHVSDHLAYACFEALRYDFCNDDCRVELWYFNELGKWQVIKAFQLYEGFFIDPGTSEPYDPPIPYQFAPDLPDMLPDDEITVTSCYTPNDIEYYN